MTRSGSWSPALAKEIRALLPVWGATVAALAAAFQSDRLGVGLLAYVAGSTALGAQSIGQEYGYCTLPMLLSQPADRRRMYVLKFCVTAVMLLTLAAVAAIVLADTWRRGTSPFAVVILPVLCGLFVAPLFTMICRSSLAGMILSASVPAVAWLATLAIAWFWFGIDADQATSILLGRLALALMVCPLFAVLGWRRFTGLEAIEVAGPAFHLPRWATSADRARRHSPLKALAMKELYLQQLTFGLVALYVIVWAALLLGQRYIPSWSTFPLGAVMLLYCTGGLAIMIGALASAEERQHRTLDWQLLQPTPAWQQWLVKVGVSLGLALTFGAGLPILLNKGTPLEGFQTSRMAGDFALLIVGLTAGSIYVSSLSGSGVRAMVLSLPVGMAVVVFAQIVHDAVRWVTLQVAGPMMAGVVSGAIAPSSVDALDVVVFGARGLSLVLIPLLLWFGFVNHTSGDRTARRILQQTAVIALLITAGIVLVGGVLAFYELRSR